MAKKQQPELETVAELSNMGIQQFTTALEANSRWFDLATDMLEELLQGVDVVNDLEALKIDKALHFADKITEEYNRNYDTIKELPARYQEALKV